MAERQRVCVVGLDGVPIGLLERLADAGVMPNIAARIAAGHLRPMRASLPEISAVSWTSFMTGVQPGEHGIFGFTDVNPGTYQLEFPNFSQVEAPTLWDRLGKRGLHSVVLNQPATYPARTIPGVLVSGFVAVDLSRSVKPLKWLGTLRRQDYRIDIDTGRARSDHDWLFQDLHYTLESRGAALGRLWDEEDWDFMQVVVTGTDRLYHYLWDAVENPDHPRHAQALDYHRAVDRFVGQIWDRFAADAAEPEKHFWMLSDHGFCAIKQEVQLNALLREQGYLGLEGGGTDLTAIDPSSRAFALDPGRIQIHLRGRYARGAVAAAEVANLKVELADAFRSLRYHGEPVIRDVHDAADLYHGQCAERGPDLVLLAHPGFDLKASPTATEIFSRTDLVGMHTWDDAFLLAPYPIEDEQLWIGDIAGHLEREFEN
jgi:predicted AlkP superfamily phosphohydrolase/phosphomutase